jgi:hypothetical protein
VSSRERHRAQTLMEGYHLQVSNLVSQDNVPRNIYQARFPFGHSTGYLSRKRNDIMRAKKKTGASYHRLRKMAYV